MTWIPKRIGGGVAPISPDRPFDEDAYEAVIAAIDELIARADAEAAVELDTKEKRP